MIKFYKNYLFNGNALKNNSSKLNNTQQIYG